MKRIRLFSMPYALWMAVFILVPLGLILYYSLTTAWAEGTPRFTLQYFTTFFQPIYLRVVWKSLLLALACTAVCLVLGYPAAMILSARGIREKRLWVLLFIIPMWMNFLLRTYAWLVLLENNGLINQFLRLLGLDGAQLLYTDAAVLMGMVYNFLPFMVFPLYSVMMKLDQSLLEAAQDLGANKVQIFLRVRLPLSMPGIISGITMVFMPAVSTFVISRLLGGGDYMLIGNLIEQQFTFADNWGFGSALSVILMIFILASMALVQKYDKNGEGGQGLL